MSEREWTGGGCLDWTRGCLGTLLVGAWLGGTALLALFGAFAIWASGPLAALVVGALWLVSPVPLAVWLRLRGWRPRSRRGRWARRAELGLLLLAAFWPALLFVLVAVSAALTGPVFGGFGPA